MGKVSGTCVVCGQSPTVRSHLFPRALIHRIRGAEKHVIEGDRDRAGVRLTQGGLWDDQLLCEVHEASLGAADDYAIRLSRRFEKSGTIAPSGTSYRLGNPQPELLLRFAYATIWRHVVSKHGASHALDLGPYRRKIEEYLFNGASLALEAIVGRSNVVDPHGNPIEVGIAPYKSKLYGWTIWLFTIGGFDFYIKTDQRPFPKAWQPFLVNDNDPLVLPLIDAMPLHQIEKFQPIFKQMLKR
jgi:hypothetical protein